MKEASLANASTIALIVHGVGDHSGRRILWRAEEGFRAFSAGAVKTEEVEFPNVPELKAGLIPNSDLFQQPGVGLEIQSDEQQHFVIPMIWSRLRPRAANEADFHTFQPASKIFDRLLHSIFFLLPACVNAIRCIPAAKGFIRRLLVALIATSYGVLVPGILAGLFLLVCYLTTLRVSLDKEHHLWWRWFLLLVILWLLYWLVVKLLMVCDFVGDVVGYAGNSKLRQKAEERLLGVIKKLASAAPDAQILVIGHSLGSVLVTQSIIQLKGEETLKGRLHILTMGSPLWLMSWFFPGRMLSPNELLVEFDKHQTVRFWINLWRDADVIGRALEAKNAAIAGNPIDKFAERCLGNGTHTDYWADPRCWQAVANYLRAVTDNTVMSLASSWAVAAQSPLSQDEKNELSQIFINRNQRAVGALGIIFIGILCAIEIHHRPEWLVTLSGFKRTLIYVVFLLVAFVPISNYLRRSQAILKSDSSGYITISDVLPESTTVPGPIQRELLAYNRLGLFIERSCLQLTCALVGTAGLAFVLWKFFTR